jgi:hypothetical protein
MGFAHVVVDNERKFISNRLVREVIFLFIFVSTVRNMHCIINLVLFW